MGKELTSKQAFELATAADVYALMTLKKKLDDIAPERGTPTGELAHCISGLLQNVKGCNDTNVGLIISNVEAYVDLRFGNLEDHVKPELRPKPLIDQLLNTLKTEQKICMAVSELKKIPEPA